MAQKKKWVAFKSNATVPADVLGAENDQKMNVGEPVQLPEGYANHVVQDGYAAFCDAPKKKPAAKKPAGGQSEAEKAAAEAAAKLKAAQERVDGLKTRMEGMTEGHPEWEALTKEMDEAVTALAELQPAT